jgi:hypothetical protein
MGVFFRGVVPVAGAGAGGRGSGSGSATPVSKWFTSRKAGARLWVGVPLLGATDPV